MDATALLADIHSRLGATPTPEPGARTLLHFLAEAVYFPLARISDGLTDDEFHWSPIEGAVSLGYVPTGHDPKTDPFTTIAWRWAHFCEELHGIAAFDICLGPEDEPWPEDVPAIVDAANAVANLTMGVRRAAVALAGATDARLDEYVDNEFGHHTRRHWATLFLVETVHHAAEIGVLRDLFRRRNLAV